MSPSKFVYDQIHTFLAATSSSRSDDVTLFVVCLSPYFFSCQLCTLTPLLLAPLHLCIFVPLHLYPFAPLHLCTIAQLHLCTVVVGGGENKVNSRKDLVWRLKT